MSAPAGVETVATVLNARPREFRADVKTAYLCGTASAMEMVGMRRLPVMLTIRHLGMMMDPSPATFISTDSTPVPFEPARGCSPHPAAILDASWTAIEDWMSSSCF